MDEAPGGPLPRNVSWEKIEKGSYANLLALAHDRCVKDAGVRAHATDAHRGSVDTIVLDEPHVKHAGARHDLSQVRINGERIFQTPHRS